MSRSTARHGRLLISSLTGAFLLSSCGLVGGDVSPDAAGSGSYPMTVNNCGAEVKINSAPERLMLLKSSAVPFLSALGVLDRATARAGEYPREYYDDATWRQLQQIPSLTSKTDTSGHLQISKEVVIDKEPDLVFGEVENLSRETLSAVDIPLLEEPALCADGIDDPGFDDIGAQLALYGKVFDRPAEAGFAADEIETEVSKLTAAPDGTRRRAAVLYPTVGGGVTYAYGTRSMAHPILEAAGFHNVFADTDERVFEVTAEELIGRDPEVVIVLHNSGSGASEVAEVADLPGGGDITAVKNNDVMPLLFNFVEPPTPLAVDGLRQIRKRFGDTP